MRRMKSLHHPKLVAKRKPMRRARAKPLLNRRMLRAGAVLLGMSIWGVAAWQVWDAGWIQMGSEEANQRLVALSSTVGFRIEHPQSLSQVAV